MNGPSSSSSSHNQPHHRHRHHHQSLPKIRKAKSQSFRTRRSPSERRSPNAPTLLTLNTSAANGDKKRSPLTPKSPVGAPPESKSPGSSSQKTPTTTLSRQGTLRASNRRKNSGQLSISLSAQNQGRRSPVGLNDRSPQGRRSPLFPSSPVQLPSPTARSPTDSQRRSPTFSIQIHTQERRSPLGAVAPSDFSCQAGPSGGYTRRSPTSTVHVQDMATEPEEAGFVGLKRPSINLFTPIYFASEKRSPMGPIPPITVSNPTETYKSAEREREAAEALAREREKEAAQAQPQPPPEKKSVMREILAFVRKPSKHISTRTNRFANAFTRAESGSSSGPLIRQSTFSASPAASSTAAKSAVQKQMSEVGFEPKMSLKFAHYTKMSLKLRRSTRREEEEKQQQQQQQQKASAVNSAAGSKRASADSNADQVGGGSGAEEEPFELANVHFEKVGESYIKHERLRELVEPELEVAEVEVEEQPDAAMAQFVEEVTNSLKVVALNGDGTVPAVHHFTRRSESREPIEPRISEERESDSNDLLIPEELRAELVEILKAYPPEPIYVNLQALRREIDEADVVAVAEAEAQPEPEEAAASLPTPSTPPAPERLPLQCPTIEFEPPSRRSSFDPPRSPFLEQLRSPGVDTETDLINLQRLDSGGDSFELVDGDRKSSRAESSFECPYSSRDTSFDVSISRYQSTSYEDQTSSFEIVDTDDRHRRHVDLRKSSIELVDAETFQRSGSSCGRKSSLETHFDYTPSETSGMTPARSPNFPMTKKQKTEHFRQLHVSPFSAFSRARSPLSQQTSSNYSSRDSYDSSSSYPNGHEPQRSPYADPSKKHFPLTIKQREEEVKTFLCTDLRCASIFEPRPSSVLTQQLSTGSMSTPSASGGYSAPRVPVIVGVPTSAGPAMPGVPSIAAGPSSYSHVHASQANTSLGSCGFSSGSEFEPPSPRRAASASPKHTFTFRIVMKKVDSSPEALCPERHRSRIIDRYRRRDSRRKRIHDAGKSF